MKRILGWSELVLAIAVLLAGCGESTVGGSNATPTLGYKLAMIRNGDGPAASDSTAFQNPEEVAI